MHTLYLLQYRRLTFTVRVERLKEISEEGSPIFTSIKNMGFNQIDGCHKFTRGPSTLLSVGTITANDHFHPIAFGFVSSGSFQNISHLLVAVQETFINVFPHDLGGNVWCLGDAATAVTKSLKSLYKNS